MTDSGPAAPRIPPHHDPACFGCGDNPFGLGMALPPAEGVETYESTVTFSEYHQGGPGLVHGGVVGAALDEACGLLATWYRFPTVTARIAIRFRRPVPINTPLSIRALVEGEKGRRVYVRGELWEAGELLAEARLAFVHVPLEHFLETPEGRAHAEAWRRRLQLG